MQKCWKIIRRSFGVLGIILMIAVLYVCAGIVAAYHVQPEISADYQETFDVSSFYTENRSADRACIIEDNVDALEIRLQMIAQAKERIILSTFEFRADESGSDILAALVAAAGRGVEVQVLVDGGFSILRMDGNPYFQALSTLDTAEIRIYNRINLLQPWKSMGRMHDKYLIVDDEVYLLGGRNTYDYFLGDNGYKNYDRDVLVYSTDPQDSNASIRQLKDYFSSVWEMEECVPFYDDSSNAGRQKIVQAREELEARYAQLVDTWQLDEMPDYAQMTLPVNRITLLSNPTQVSSKEPTVFYALTRLMQNAKEEVRIHTPYIICNDWMYQCLQEVCSGQASVSLMTNSAANNGNPFGSTDYVKKQRPAACNRPDHL
jgi:phosphatidylserine/phosphatidylglycerophosphate/cardiolipin synthase-like enzyme